jgi:hypothetical protein
VVSNNIKRANLFDGLRDGDRAPPSVGHAKEAGEAGGSQDGIVHHVRREECIVPSPSVGVWFWDKSQFAIEFHTSDLHLHNLVVGGDHFVADLHKELHRKVGLLGGEGDLVEFLSFAG